MTSLLQHKNIQHTLYISTVVQQQNAVIAKGYDYHDVKFELSLANPYFLSRSIKVRKVNWVIGYIDLCIRK